jgi:Flp pilus assembly protein TadD
VHLWSVADQGSQVHAPAVVPVILRCAYGRADASPRVRQNLALVVALQGRLAEAEAIVKADQPAAEANVAFLERLLSRKDGARAEADSTKATAR